jgi:DEAD/DEAH box helicase domain-containing protein
MIELGRVLSDLPRRSTQAIVGLEAPQNPWLRRHLSERLSADAGRDGSLLAEPVIEGAFPWEPAEAGEAKAFLDGCDPVVRRQVRHAPYRHQLSSWQALLDTTPRSVIVTAGTGAGKTECFLLPVVEHLARLAKGKPVLTGVRAIMLYPLNALINSQRDRLSDWLDGFDGRIRFALYNGATPEDDRSTVRPASRAEVVTRRAIRETPPPVLVTNPAMLEYMLVRRQDTPILEKSKGKLDFIILDEAHNYVGSQAAELALLLRRVCLSFGRDPADIRYVATSATIGEGQDTDERLRAFLAKVTGAPPDRVMFVRGRRADLILPPAAPAATVDPADILECTPEERWVRLAVHPDVQSFVRALHAGPQPWRRWTETATRTFGRVPSASEAGDLLGATAAATATANPDDAKLLPARVHLFHRSVTGLYACANPRCEGRPAEAGGSGWRFGAVHLDPVARCVHCDAPVFELTFCDGCGREELECEQTLSRDGTATLSRPMRARLVDEFRLDGDRDGDDDADPDAPVGTRRYFLGLRGEAGQPCDVDQAGTIVDNADGERTWRLWLTAAENEACRCTACGTAARGGNRGDASGCSFRIGAPFLLGTMLPTVLGAVAPADPAPGPAPPFGGRRLLVFSDSRQGTARIAAKLQIDAERHFVRAFLYHRVQRRDTGPGDEVIRELRSNVDRLRLLLGLDPGILPILKDYEARLAAAVSDEPRPVTWIQLRDELASSLDFERHVYPLWKERLPEIKAKDLADLVLHRELARRPKKANSAETLGLVRLCLPPDAIGNLRPPSDWPLGKEDWDDLLHILMTHVLRSRSVVAVDAEAAHWMRWKMRFLRAADRIDGDRRYTALPSARILSRPGFPNLPRLIAQACNLPIDRMDVADRIDGWIGTAAQHLRNLKALRQSGGDGELLHLDALSLGAVSDAPLCPLTRRVLDRTLNGLSPYPQADGRCEAATKIHFPRHPDPFLTTGDQEGIEDWLANDPGVRSLVELGVWNNLQTRVATSTDWIRVVEHSAQQPIQRLKKFEDDFKSGRVNVLSSSTTLEMGVDIGELEAVVMTNAPPSAANYRQRVGRAGRRRQALALGVTLCRDRPHDQAIFRNPLKPLQDAIRPPSVALGSETIARRHVNAWLLGTWIRTGGMAVLKMELGYFFGLSPDSDTRPTMWPARAFAGWLDSLQRQPEAAVEILEAIGMLLKGTPVRADASIFGTVHDAIVGVEQAVLGECEALRQTMLDSDRDATKSANRLRLSRLLSTFILGDLAERGFLPGYGFPRNIVPLVTVSAAQIKAAQNKPFTRRDEMARSDDNPSREIDLALAEYAPGAEVVINGLVYRSGGITLNWKRPASVDQVREIQALATVWRCQSCGTIGSRYAEACDICGSSVTSHPMLTPSGFAVDVRDRPHDDPTTVAYVPPPETWVSAAGVPWRPLPTPEVGDYRATANGAVVVMSHGTYGTGYAICLSCGRAEAEAARGSAGTPLEDHRPLRFGAEGGACPGNHQPFAIRRWHGLGRSYTTDVFELRIVACRSRKIALALAVALREALAEALGIESDEIGVEATESRLEGGETVWSAVLLDRADGGAGFASSAASGTDAGSDLVALLGKAKSYLECPVHCDGVCEHCLLSSTTQHIAKELDRAGALTLMRDIVVPQLVLDPALAIFGPESRAELSNLDDALDRSLLHDPHAALDLWLYGDPAVWDLDKWVGGRLAAQWSAREASVRIVVGADDLRTMVPSDRLGLGRFIERTGTALYSSDAVPSVQGRPVLARVASVAWASDASTALPGPDWGRGLVVRGPFQSERPLKRVDVTQLFRLPPNLILVEIRGELDGSTGSLPERIRALLSANGLSEAFRSEAMAITYADRYLASPLSLRLATALIDAFRPTPRTRVTVTTQPLRTRDAGPDPSTVKHDWRSQTQRSTVVSQWWRTSGRGHWIWSVMPEMPHARRLSITFAGGVTLELTLDQGMGFLSSLGFRSFPFQSEEARQAGELSRELDVAARSDGRHPATFWTASVKEA